MKNTAKIYITVYFGAATAESGSDFDNVFDKIWPFGLGPARVLHPTLRWDRRSARRRESDAAEGDAAAAERKKSLTFQLSHLLRVLWSGKILLATPHRLLAAVYEHGPRFSGFEQQDAQDFYYFLLERTHDELVRADSLLNAAAISPFCLTSVL